MHCKYINSQSVTKSLQQIPKIGFRSSKTPYLNEIFAKFELLKIKDIFKLEVCSIVYKALQRSLPPCFDDIFIYNHERHDINLRNKNNLYVPTFKKTLFRQSLLFISVKT